MEEQGAADEQQGTGGAAESSAGDAGQRLDEERKKASNYLENWQRAQADFVNYRRRSEQEKSELLRFGNTSLLLRILPVIDDFERAWTTMPEDVSNLPWTEGIRLVERKLKSILEQEGATEIRALGQEFDPNVHEAVAYEDAGPENANKVISEFQKGYKLNDRILRPSMVKVGK